jgi:hypothetical protein
MPKEGLVDTQRKLSIYWNRYVTVLVPTGIVCVHNEEYDTELQSVNILCISDSVEANSLTVLNFPFHEHLMDKEIQTKRCITACLQRIGAMNLDTSVPRGLVLVCMFFFDNRCSTEVRMELYSWEEFPSAQRLIYNQLGKAEAWKKLEPYTEQDEFDTLFIAYFPRGYKREPDLTTRAFVAEHVEYSDSEDDSDSDSSSEVEEDD